MKIIEDLRRHRNALEGEIRKFSDLKSKLTSEIDTIRRDIGAKRLELTKLELDFQFREKSILAETAKGEKELQFLGEKLDSLALQLGNLQESKEGRWSNRPDDINADLQQEKYIRKEAQKLCDTLADEVDLLASENDILRSQNKALQHEIVRINGDQEIIVKQKELSESVAVKRNVIEMIDCTDIPDDVAKIEAFKKKTNSIAVIDLNEIDVCPQSNQPNVEEFVEAAVQKFLASTAISKDTNLSREVYDISSKSLHPSTDETYSEGNEEAITKNYNAKFGRLPKCTSRTGETIESSTSKSIVDKDSNMPSLQVNSTHCFSLNESSVGTDLSLSPCQFNRLYGHSTRSPLSGRPPKYPSREHIINGHVVINIEDEECRCESQMFDGKTEHIEFYLPQTGLICTCGKQRQHLIDPNDPYHLSNILRPWQIDFLQYVGITDVHDFIQQANERGSSLAQCMKQWRYERKMMHIKTKSCRVAIHIWCRVCQSFLKGLIPKKSLSHNDSEDANKPEFIDVSTQSLSGTISTLGFEQESP
jgi:hypothetical protein